MTKAIVKVIEDGALGNGASLGKTAGFVSSHYWRDVLLLSSSTTALFPKLYSIAIFI